MSHVLLRSKAFVRSAKQFVKGDRKRAEKITETLRLLAKALAAKPPHTQAQGQTGWELGVHRRIRPPHSLRLRGKSRPTDHPLARRRHPQGSLLNSHPVLLFPLLNTTPPPCHCEPRSGVAIHAFLTPVIASHGVVWQSSRNFGILDYDTDWIAASTLSGFLARTG